MLQIKIIMAGKKFSDFFVVFQNNATQNEWVAIEKPTKEILKIENNWKVSFSQNPTKEIHLDKLISWSNLEQDELKYFSGTATYSHDFVLTAKQLKTLKL